MNLSIGQKLYDRAAQVYPICRSITGNGVRKTLRMLGERIPMVLFEVPSGGTVFDWQVPLEWNIDDASVTDSDGLRVIDFGRHNLHIVSYSEPVSQTLSLDELAPRLHSAPEHPEWIPYRTSYYRRNWGFCLAHDERMRLRAGNYRVDIKSSLQPCGLTYGEVHLPGSSREEVVLFTHVCHPSLANDNAAGMSVAAEIAEWLSSEPRRYTYRLVFAPGTIGSLCWLKRNESRLNRIRHGLVLGLLGDSGALTYKRSRRGNAEIDSVAEYALAGVAGGARMIDFSPYGYDERQLCSPGFNLPFGRLTRSVNGGYPEYHSSADDMSLVRPEFLHHSYEACQRIISVLEGDAQYVNLSPKGEPQLGKRGLYGSVGGRSPADREHAMLWILNQSDGTHSLLDIAKRSGIAFSVVRQAASDLEGAKLLAPAKPRRQAEKRSHPRAKNNIVSAAASRRTGDSRSARAGKKK
jgi:aminopeptidase-like protein